MIYTDIIKYFERGAEGALALLERIRPELETIEEIKGQLKAYQLSDEESLNSGLSTLTGIYMELEPIFEVAQAYKEINEDRAFLKIRNEAIKNSEKVTDTILKTQAHESVAQYIILRNSLEAYVNSCEKGIVTIQSLRKRNERDYNSKA